MTRQNLFSGMWDGDNEDAGTRRRAFWRPDDARMGATLYELAPGTPESRMHMHYGAEEMFFVLSGSPVLRNQHGTETLAPGDVSSARRDGPGCTHSAIRLTNRPRSWRSAPGAPRRSRLSRTRIRVGGHSRSRS
jgi:Cupin domain